MPKFEQTDVAAFLTAVQSQLTGLDFTEQREFSRTFGAPARRGRAPRG